MLENSSVDGLGLIKAGESASRVNLAGEFDGT